MKFPIELFYITTVAGKPIEKPAIDQATVVATIIAIGIVVGAILLL